MAWSVGYRASQPPGRERDCGSDSSGPAGCGRCRAGDSAALEVALAVPVVDHGVVLLLLDPGRVEVVGDDVLAEDRAGSLGALQLADRLPQRPGHARHARRDVAVALVLGRQLQPALDAVQP